MYLFSLWVSLVLAVLQVGVPASPPVKPDPVKIVKTEYDPRELAENRERNESRAETPGRKLFISRCALCHDPLGQPIPRRTLGPWLDAAVVTARGEAAVRSYILNGSAAMPGFQYQFDGTKIDQVVAYLKTIPPDARPKGLPPPTTSPAAPAVPDAQ
jgi:mono/diheme cytochrome c family protein